MPLPNGENDFSSAAVSGTSSSQPSSLAEGADRRGNCARISKRPGSTESGSQNQTQHQPRLGPVGWAPGDALTSWWPLISPTARGVLFGGPLGTSRAEGWSFLEPAFSAKRWSWPNGEALPSRLSLNPGSTPGCVNLDKLLRLPGPQFLHQRNGDGTLYRTLGLAQSPCMVYVSRYLLAGFVRPV